MSEDLFNKFHFKLKFEANKFILTKNGLYMVSGNLNKSMFKLDINNNTSRLDYILAPFLLMFLLVIYYHQVYCIIIYVMFILEQ